MIIIDRKCLSKLVDLVEDKEIVEPETRQEIIRQMRRLIQVSSDKEAGRLNGRPRKVQEIIDF